MNWFTRLLEWIKGFFVKKEEKRDFILSRITSRDKKRVLSEIHRDTLEAIATWQIKEIENRDTSFFLHLDLMYSQKGEGFRRYTHRFTIHKSVLMKGGKTYQQLVAICYADLQGNDIDPNRFAKTIIRSIAMEILELPPIEGWAWSKRLIDYPWQETLREYSRQVLNHDRVAGPKTWSELMN